MFNQASSFLLQTVEFLLIYPALMRFYMQLFRAPPRNPLVPVVMALTDFAVRPLRRFVPGFSGLDLSSLFWAWIVEMLILLALFAVAGANVLMGGPQVLSAILFLALLRLFEMSLYLLIFDSGASHLELGKRLQSFNAGVRQSYPAVPSTGAACAAAYR
jgi:YggT family protein